MVERGLYSSGAIPELLQRAQWSISLLHVQYYDAHFLMPYVCHIRVVLKLFIISSNITLNRAKQGLVIDLTSLESFKLANDWNFSIIEKKSYNYSKFIQFFTNLLFPKVI